MTDQPRTIVLVGAPGSGKTTTGGKLARRLQMDFMDIDHVIEAEQGITIPEIFSTRGERAFRELEHETTLRVMDRPGIVSLGGGAVKNPDIRRALLPAEVVWLQVTAEGATRRMGKAAAHRPLLAGGVQSTMEKLLEERRALYDEVATHRIDTNGLTATAVVRRIMAIYGFENGGAR